MEMDKSEIIIEVIKQDMRFNQFIAALRKLDIEVYFDLDLISTVAELLEINMTDSWMELYVTELRACLKFSNHHSN